MSRWVRGIYNTAANFVLSRSLRAASGSSMGRNAKHLQDGSNKSGKCIESDKPSEPVKSNNECGSDTDCLGCAPFSCARHDPNSNHFTNLHVDGCICSVCREYNEYTNYTASVRTEGQGSSSRIRTSNESRSTKQPNTVAAGTDVEHTTGIPTGVTI
jgi:hypothetical protein